MNQPTAQHRAPGVHESGDFLHFHILQSSLLREVVENCVPIFMIPQQCPLRVSIFQIPLLAVPHHLLHEKLDVGACV